MDATSQRSVGHIDSNIVDVVARLDMLERRTTDVQITRAEIGTTQTVGPTVQMLDDSFDRSTMILVVVARAKDAISDQSLLEVVNTALRGGAQWEWRRSCHRQVKSAICDRVLRRARAGYTQGCEVKGSRRKDGNGWQTSSATALNGASAKIFFEQNWQEAQSKVCRLTLVEQSQLSGIDEQLVTEELERETADTTEIFHLKIDSCEIQQRSPT